MALERSVPEKVRDWLQAYNAVRAELSPEAFRVLTALANVTDTDGGIDAARVHLGMDAARIVFANDRTAAEVAASLTMHVRTERSV